jgi:hypothetical protein
MGGFLDADAAGELAEVIASDDESSRLAVDMAQARLGSDDSIESTRLYRAADETAFTSW